MNFAGQNYAYISKKKIEKSKQLRNKTEKNMLNTVKEEIEDINLKSSDLMNIDSTANNKKFFLSSEAHDDPMTGGEINSHNDKEININACSSSSSNVPRRKRSISRERKRRSRSNSIEKINDEELDCVYSDEEEIEHEVEKVYEQELEYININNNDKKKSTGLFSKIGDKFKNIFSSKKKDNNNLLSDFSNANAPQKEKKVLYKVSKMKQQEAKECVYEHEVDTNVFSINFEFLKDKVAYATGDPITCTCEAVLNIHSKISPIQDSDKQLWLCEFCGASNEIFIEKEEIPSADCIDYFVQSISQLKQGYNYNDEASLIFCFDISGSMCVSSPVTGKHKFKGNTLEKNMKDLMAFSDGSDQFYGGFNSRNVTYISRLQCLQAAIESNLSNLLKVSPNRKVGFVAFNNEVVGYGDGTKEIVKINGNNLNDFEVIKSIAEKNNNIISTPLKDAHNYLLKELYTIEETGQTALGPAILFSINLINASAGSRIILCTDGISNTGIGSMENKTSNSDIDELKTFYTNLGTIAKSKGIVIDLITFEDEQSNIDILMAMIDETGGEIIRVKPTEILEQFSNLLTNEVVATNVRVKVKLHKIMHFRNEEEKDIKNNGSTLIKEVGNATKESELYIEYNFKSSDEIAKFNDIDIDNLTEVPFQSIIDYTNKTGDRCIRVVTKNQKICSEKDVIQKEANFNIISTNAIQKTSKLAKEGNYRAAQSNALAWKKMMKSNISSNQNAENNYRIFSNNMCDFNNNLQEVQFQALNSMPKDNSVFGQSVQSAQIRSDKLTSQIHTLKNISNTRSAETYSKKKK
jgi:hypothetical protein